MDKKVKVILGLAFLIWVILACNLPIVGRNATPTTEPGIMLGSTPGLVVTDSAGSPPVPANTDGAETVLVPGGTFWMGSEETDTEANVDEIPRHQVTHSGFYIYTHEVTNEMYARCVEAGACLPIQIFESGPTTHYGDPEYAEYPVVGVDWLMAEDYCVWAGGRLPTEAEWELAARGTESETFPWGTEKAACDRVNMLGCITPADTVKVGSYANGNSPYEAWDMSGNVWEWVNDWYDDNYYSFSPATNPIGPYFSELKVVRGGGLYSEGSKMRSAERAGTDPHRAYDDVGFRCVPTGLQLPEDFAEPADYHIMGAENPLEGGGERLDDPEGVPPVPPGPGSEESPELWVDGMSASCPDAEGVMHVTVHGGANVEGDFSVSVNGTSFDCSYDVGEEMITCQGPAPEGLEEMEYLDLLVGHSEFGEFGFRIHAPEGCTEDTTIPTSFEDTVSCPTVEGFVTLHYVYEPAMTWETITLDGEVLECVEVSPNETTCIAPARPIGDSYIVEGVGTLVDGGGAVRFVAITAVRDDCEEEDSLSVTTTCFEDHPMAQINYTPFTRNIVRIWSEDGDMTCIGMAPGVQICGNLPGAPGDAVDFSLCFTETECYNAYVTVPECPGTEPAQDYSIEPACYVSLGPVVVIHYSPADLPLVAANANGADLTCYDSPDPGYYMCSGIPGAAGSTMTITFCLSDGTCPNSDIVVPDCSAGTGPVGFWNLLDVNCLHLTDIYMIIDTPVSEIVPGSDFHYNVHTADGVNTYTCEIHPDIAGRIYCHGAPPMHNSPLEVCVSVGAAEEHCTSFDDFFIRVPLCEAPPTEAPVETEAPGTTEEPELPVVNPACSTYSDGASCNSAPAGCFWLRDLKSGQYHCVSR